MICTHIYAHVTLKKQNICTHTRTLRPAKHAQTRTHTDMDTDIDTDTDTADTATWMQPQTGIAKIDKCKNIVGVISGLSTAAGADDRQRWRPRRDRQKDPRPAFPGADDRGEALMPPARPIPPALTTAERSESHKFHD